MSTSPLLSQWSQILEAGPEQSGGKGWNLARLAHYGLPVADAVAIPADYERAWLKHSGLLTQLMQAADTSEDEPEKLQTLHKELLRQPLLQPLITALDDVLIQRGRQNQPLAVRSSATTEDSKQYSFAGIHLSRLNIIGAAELAQAVREVWASLWTPTAVAYRRHIGLDHEAVAMAVVIMPLVPAQSCGIAFTCDPHSGRDDRIHIHAHWGLGEALVNGTARGDEIVLCEEVLDDSLQLLSYHSGDKSTMTITADHGTKIITTPTAQAQQQVLTEPMALKLGRLVRDAAIALDFVHPFFDIEWVWDGTQFWLVQARPITALPRNTYPELINQPEIWTRGNTCEVLPEPLSAIDWFSSRRLVNLLLEQGPQLIRYPLLPGAQRAGLFGGRLYLNLSMMQWEFYEIFGLQPQAINAMMGGHQPEISLPTPNRRNRLRRFKNLLHYALLSHKLRRSAEDELQQAHATAREWRQQPLPKDEAAMLDRLREQNRYIRSAKGIFFLQASSGASLSQLTEIIEKHLPDEGHALTAALLTGGTPSVTAQQSYAMVELARIAAEDITAREWLGNPGRDNDWQRQLPPDNPFRLAFADFIERFGHRAVYESYLRNPHWREAPGYLLDTIYDLIGTDLKSLQQQQRKAAQNAQQRINKKLPRWLRPIIRKMSQAAIREVNHREAARSAFVSLAEPLRTTLLTIGRLWQQHGVLQSADDIFNLTPPEICDALNGDISLQGLANRVADRHRQLVAWQAVPVEAVVLQHDHSVKRVDTNTSVAAISDDTFKGVAVGTGVGHGIARILHSPAEGKRLKKGEILVAPSTDPGWTPLFLKAGGIVVETGGSLSHSAIVAREFGIPAVVNLPGILEQIKDGELLEVDGRQGVVKRLQSEKVS